MMAFCRQIGLVLGLTVCFAGCRPFTPPGKSPLRPAALSPQTMVLEILFARFPLGDPRANVTLWGDVDEQRLPTDVRLRLQRNGFRVGIIGGGLPAALAQILELKDGPPLTVDELNSRPVELESDAKVLRRHLQVRPGQRSELIASEVYPELAALLADGGQISGQTFQQAQAMLALKAFPEHDGRVRVDVVPEVHYGQVRQRWTGQQGMLRLEAGRERRTYDALGVVATLAPGHMLVMSSLPNRSGSLGRHFFCEEKTGRPEQKLLVIRLVQTQHDETLPAAEETLPLREDP